MGAWGGWALAPDIADGEDYRSHAYWSSQPRRRSKRSAIFLTFFAAVPRRLSGNYRGKSRRKGPIRVVCRGFVRLHGSRCFVNGSAHGSVIGVGRFSFGRSILPRCDRHRRRTDNGRDGGEGVGLACPKQIVAAGRAEIARGVR